MSMYLKSNSGISLDSGHFFKCVVYDACCTDTGSLPGGRKRSTVQRSEEIGMPDNLRKDSLMTKQYSRESNESVSSDSSSQ